MSRDESIFTHAFLDPICEDRIKSSWTIQSDVTQAFVNLRNLRWTGYYAWNQVETPDHGSFYYGDGKINSDLAFML